MADIEKVSKAIKEIVELNPEATKELGKTAVTLTKAINVALSPIAGIVWGYDKISNYLQKRLSEILRDVPEENIIMPPINIAGPTIEAMRFTGENDELREMYAKLLASSMNKDTTKQTHPRFVEIIKNLSVTEAKLIHRLCKQRSIPFIDLTIVDTKDTNDHQTKFYPLYEPNLYKDLNIEFQNVLTCRLAMFIENMISLGIIEITSNPISVFTNDKIFKKILNETNQYQILSDSFINSEKYIIPKKNI